MDLIYKIAGVLLYDNQLDFDYLIFYNKRESFYGGDDSILPYEFTSLSIYKICNLDKSDTDYNSKSISIMQDASRCCDLLMVKNDGFLKPFKNSKTGRDNYNGYEIFWNETKSGINVFDYNMMAVWNVGSSSYTSYRLDDFKKFREQ